MVNEVFYVVGECGHDRCTVVHADDIPEEQHKQFALEVLDFKKGLEVGMLYKQLPFPGHARLRVLDTTEMDWVPMCGGITQVIGKALIETALGDLFELKQGRLDLLTDSGTVPIVVDTEGTITEMDRYAESLYKMGVQRGLAGSVPVVDVGEFLVMRIEDLSEVHPGLDFTRRTPGEHLDIVNAYTKSCGKTMTMLWDLVEDGYRLFPRFLDETAQKIPYEFQCGTGTVAFVIALTEIGHLFRDIPHRIQGNLEMEWGNIDVTPDPWGVRVSNVWYELVHNRVKSVSYNHSAVKIHEAGTLWLRGESGEDT